MSKNVLLLSDEILKDRTTIHTNIDPKLLYPEIKVCQDMYIHPILGTALYNKIITDINASGTTTGAYKILLDDYIIDALMYYVLAESNTSISYQYWNKGVVRKIGDNTELPTMSELVDISNHYRNRAEWYGERLTKYLKQNATESVLSEYLQPGDGIDVIQPESTAFTMPIYLGDHYQCESLDKNNCNCNGEEYQ